MAVKYRIRRSEGQHISRINRVHLGREWKRRIAANDTKTSFRSFAKEMGIPESSWRREYYLGGGHRPVKDLKTGKLHYGDYDPELAQERATFRASQKGPAQKMTNIVAAEFAGLLSETDARRSPYSAWIILKKRFADRILPCLRTFYNHIAAGDIGVEYGSTPYHPGRKKRSTQSHPAMTRPGRRTLEDRKADAPEVTGPGHLEMDTVVSGKGGRGGVLVLQDRFTKLYLAEPLKRISQECVTEAIRRLRGSKRLAKPLSVTTDNGCEFLDQERLDKTLGAKVYYTRAYAAYEKGGVENANRFFRRWFPKGTDFSQVSAMRIHKVIGFMNDTPRASLGGRSANEAAAAAS